MALFPIAHPLERDPTVEALIVTKRRFKACARGLKLRTWGSFAVDVRSTRRPRSPIRR